MKRGPESGRLISPIVRVILHEGRPSLLKDYRRLHWITRKWLAPWLARREYQILRRLQGIPGIPQVYKIMDGGAVLMELIEGRTIQKCKPGDLPDDVFRHLSRTVEAMHARGVVHLDLRHKKNILITPRGQAILVDFTSALQRNGAVGAIWNRLVQIDHSGLLKIKYRNFHHLLTATDREALRKHRILRQFWVLSPRGRYAR